MFCPVSKLQFLFSVFLLIWLNYAVIVSVNMDGVLADDSSLKLTGGPSSPGSPFSPGAPGGPRSPASPCLPGRPASPRAPFGPSLPAGPEGPAAPGLPCGAKRVNLSGSKQKWLFYLFGGNSALICYI